MTDYEISHVRLTCADEGDGSGNAEPFLWPFLFKIDDVVLGEVLTRLETEGRLPAWVRQLPAFEALLDAGAPADDAWSFTPNGDHGNIRGDVDEGDSRTIAGKVGTWPTGLVTNALPKDKAMLGMATVLLEEDDVPGDSQMAKHYAAFCNGVRDRLFEIVSSELLTIDQSVDDDGASGDGPTDHDLSLELFRQVRDRFEKGEGELGPLSELTNRDDVIGGAVHLVLSADVPSNGSVAFKDRWKPGNPSEDGDFTLHSKVRSLGNIHVHPLGKDGTLGPAVYADSWTRGWTSAQYFTRGDAAFLFLLKKAGTGGEGFNAHVYRVERDGSIGDRVHDYKWSEGWSTVEFVPHGQETFLFLLKADGYGNDDNNVHVHRMRSDGAVGERVASHKWTTGWTTARFYPHASGTRLLLVKKAGFDGDGNNVQVRDVNFPGGSGFDIGAEIENHRWTQGWTTAEFFRDGATTMLLLLKADGYGDDGTNTRVYALDSDGGIRKRVAGLRWTEGWADAVVAPLSAGLFGTGSSGGLRLVMGKADGFAGDHGNVHVDEIRLKDDGVEFRHQQTYSFSEGPIVVRSVRIAGSTYVLVLRP